MTHRFDDGSYFINLLSLDFFFSFNAKKTNGNKIEKKTRELGIMSHLVNVVNLLYKRYLILNKRYLIILLLFCLGTIP